MARTVGVKVRNHGAEMHFKHEVDRYKGLIQNYKDSVNERKDLPEFQATNLKIEGLLKSHKKNKPSGQSQRRKSHNNQQQARSSRKESTADGNTGARTSGKSSVVDAGD